MTEPLRNSVSALVDQEASEFEARKVLDSLENHPDLTAYWGACHAISATLRGESMAPPTLLAGIHQAIDEGSDQAVPLTTPTVDTQCLPPTVRVPSRWGAFAGQVALAASIAFALVVGVKVIAPVEPAPTAGVARTEVPDLIQFQLPVQKETVAVGALEGEKADSASAPDARVLTEQSVRRLVSQRLGGYLVRHAENNAVVGGVSVLPLARIMGRDEPIR